jgi:hypothetical protein
MMKRVKIPDPHSREVYEKTIWEEGGRRNENWKANESDSVTLWTD